MGNFLNDCNIIPAQNMRKLLLFLIILIFSPSSQESLKGQDSLIFVVRIDDILSRNTTILPRSIRPLQDTLASRGAVATWGFMPHRLFESANADGNLKNELIETHRLGHEVSQHGYIHICQICGQSSHEMYCTYYNRPLSNEQQEKLIIDGVQIMMDSLGFKPTSFIPPGHVFEQTTWSVLERLGFPVISTASTSGFVYETLYNLPITAEYTWALSPECYESKLSEVLEDIETERKQVGYYSLMMHDPFIRLGYQDGITLRWMAELLDSLNHRYDDRIVYASMTDAAKKIEQNVGTSGEFYDEFMHQRGIELHSNYPNQFNPSTRISFTLRFSDLVSIYLVSMSGQKFVIQPSQYYTVGSHQIELSMANFATGNYLLVVENSKDRASRMISFVK